MMICRCCGCRFAEPIVRRVKENLDGENGWWTYTEKFCPACGDDNIDEEENDED